MTHPWQPGQLLFVGFEGVDPPRELLRWIAAGRVGGVILFARNLRDPHEVRRLVRLLREDAPPEVPVTVAIDQEGGRVQRLRSPWTSWPPMRRLGELGEASITARVATAMAIELTELGIGLDFAPVVDVDTNPANPVIGDRSFGRDPKVVSSHVTAFIEHMQRQGVATCAKHFPGHGDTHTDSHHELPRVSHDLHRLREVELAPFIAAAGAKVASMMTSHVVYEAIDARRPATLSPDVMNLLREEIGYDSLVFSDDLEMKAVADHYRPEALVRGSLEAGVDALLVCSRLDLAKDVLGRLERLPDVLVEKSIARMHAFKQAFAPPPLPEIDPEQASARPPYPEHEELARRVTEGDF
jgi:beta-N-acetylhexosaminidase